MGEREEKLETLGYPMSDTPKAAGLYTPLVVDGRTAYLSGAVPVEAGELKFKGSRMPNIRPRPMAMSE